MLIALGEAYLQIERRDLERASRQHEPIEISQEEWRARTRAATPIGGSGSAHHLAWVEALLDACEQVFDRLGTGARGSLVGSGCEI